MNQNPAETIENLTPREIVAELDRYIVGQANAKRAVAIALRNRYRRARLPIEMREEVIPKNILMIGPTGVGKTEIARRLAKLARAPFLKIEATKFTEVGYVGRDVESMVRDLVQISIRLVEAEMTEAVEERARDAAVERIVDILQPRRSKPAKVAADAARSAQDQWSEMQQQMSRLFGGAPVGMIPPNLPKPETAPEEKKPEKTDDEYERKRSEQEDRIRQRLGEQIRSGARDDEEVEIETEESGGGTPIGILPLGGPGGGDGNGQDIGEMLSQFMPKKRKKRRTTISEAKKIFTAEAAQSLIDRDAVTREAVRRAEEGGIIFLDEIDKVAGRGGGGGNAPDVSREGVQRDLLPIIEGSTVQTKYGPVRTNYVLFIAAGAFHVAKPSDLIPELQGRLPIRVELESLNEDDFRRILTEPRSALTKQYAALLATEGMTVTFTDDAVHELARIAVDVNTRTENIGARRLQTVMERLLEELSFDAPETPDKTVTIDGAFVRERLDDVASDEDMSRYIL